MSGHVHYDLEAMEREFRTMHEDVRARMDQAVARGDAEAPFARAQSLLFEVRLQASLRAAQLVNEGIPADTIAAALGVECGAIQGSFMRSTGNDVRLLKRMLEWATKVYWAAFDDGPFEGAIGENRVFPPTPGGHA